MAIQNSGNLTNAITTRYTSKYQRAAEMAPQTNEANIARDRLTKLP